ncbi:MAG TPA: hypothetical protein DEP45_03710 [Armatimonadetes bacterium]|nr:hypothetical protein [Armatimonadota bacterium]
MPKRICPNCGKTVPDWNYCAECGTPLPQQVGAELSLSDLPPSMPPQDAASSALPEDRGAGEEAASFDEEPSPEAAGEPGAASDAPPAAAVEWKPRVPHDGQLRCPNCQEAVYAGERVCWNCARRLETTSAYAERPAPHVGAPESGALVSRTSAPQVARAPRPRESLAATPQQSLPHRTSDEAMAAAWWAFGLGLLSVFTCGVLGILGLPALWLGVSAARRNAGPVAVAGAVFGAIGLLILLAWILMLALSLPGMSELLRPPPTHIMIPTCP